VYFFPMRIVFMGSPDFAVPSLAAVHGSRHQVAAVVTQPDRPKGRGHHLAATAVKEQALALNLPVLQPESVKDPAFFSQLQALNPDLSLIVAFSVLPEAIVNLPPKGCVNIHASLLPKYRGAAPIQWAVYHGETETGLTYFRLNRSVDTGDMYRQVRVPIPDGATGGELYAILKEEGAKHIVEILDGIEAGSLRPVPQPATGSCPAPKLKKEHGRLDWLRPARDLWNQVRAFNPFPGTYTNWKEMTLAVTRARFSDVPAGSPPGTFLGCREEALSVATGSGTLEILEVKPQNGKNITAKDFFNGHHIAAGEVFG
jgi:methionyl-tRNA formyltransferase